MLGSLTISGLVVERGGRTVLNGLSFDMSAGQALVVRGANGSGKTTLLRALAGLVDVAGGTVPDLEGKVAYQGHMDALKPAFTVRQNLDFWMQFSGSSADGEKALADVGLAPLADLPAKLLSAGQRRRLALARLVAVQKPLWLMDEPTAALDSAGRAMVAQLVEAHLASGGMAIIASHDELDLAAARLLELGA